MSTGAIEHDNSLQRHEKALFFLFQRAAPASRALSQRVHSTINAPHGKQQALQKRKCYQNTRHQPRLLSLMMQIALQLLHSRMAADLLTQTNARSIDSIRRRQDSSPIIEERTQLVH